jgi:hypothetical protein
MGHLSGLPVLLLTLVSSVPGAEERELQIRNVILPSGPDQMARPVYVAGAVATVLRFEKSVDPARTKMVDWEGRFEPLLAGGKSVVLVPPVLGQRERQVSASILGSCPCERAALSGEE